MEGSRISPYDVLPNCARGNSWFWPMMKEGENGVEFAMRQPEIRPGDFGILLRWTKVNPGGIVALLVHTPDGADRLFKGVVDKENRIQWPECFENAEKRRVNKWDTE